MGFLCIVEEMVPWYSRISVHTAACVSSCFEFWEPGSKDM